MTTPDLGQRVAVLETLASERHAESMRRIAGLETKVEKGFAEMSERLGVLPERLATVEAQTAENRRNIARLWKWGGGIGAAVTGAAAALARWWG